MLLIASLAHFSISIIVEPLFLSSLASIFPALFKQILAILDNLILLNDFSILVALKLRERIGVFSFIL